MKNYGRAAVLAVLFLLISFALIMGLAGRASAQIVDPTFAPLLQDFGSTQNRAVAKVSELQPDGKILVGGRFTVASGLARSGVARFNADGTPDPTFDAGNIGVAQTILSVTTGGTIYAIRVQPDGKILIGGQYRRDNETTARCLERLNADGSVDTTFQSAIVGDFASVGDIQVQTDGKVVVGGSFDITAVNPANGQSVTFHNLARLNPDGSFDFSFTPSAPENITSVVVQPDGKVVVGNASTNANPNQLIRYNTNGSLDAVLAEFDDWINKIRLLPDGKFVVVGYFKFVNDVFQKFIVRLNPDGSQDASFVSNVQIINSLSFADVAIQPDGKVIVSGEFSSIDSFTRWRVARFNTDGSMDTSFNTATPIAGVVGEVLALPDGKVFIGGAFPLEDNNLFYNNIGRLNADGSIDTNFNHANVIMEGEGYSILQQPDGKVLIGGFIYYANDVKRRGLARYNADGTLDTGFVPYQNLAWGLDIALQPDGKILIVNSDSPSSLFRLNPDGSLDTTFTAPFVPFSASIQKRTRITQIVIQPDGKILVSGQLITGSATSPTLSGLARLNQDGSRDTSFQLVGALGGTRDVHDIALQPDGKIVIGGDFSHINNNGAFHYLARINPDGTIDTSFSSPFPPSSSPVIYEIELQPDGKVVYAGNFNFVLRVDPNGTPDAAFNVPVNNQVEALKVQPNGKILVGGYFTGIGGAARDRIARLNPDGSVDAGFNLPKGANNIVYDFSLQADGKILVAGAFTKLGNQPRIGAARLIETGGARFDFDGDGRSDVSVFRPSSTVWYIRNSLNGSVTYANFGSSGDMPAPADFDGDGKTDMAIFRPSNGAWYWMNSSNGNVGGVIFGSQGDLPVAGDFDGDGKADQAVFRPSTGVWYVLNSSTGSFAAVQFGSDGDKPVVGDFDGDRKVDFTVYRPWNGVWYRIGSSNGQFSVTQFGIAEDKPVAGDYDGDGRDDICVFRPSSGAWYRLNSSDGSFAGNVFGMQGDFPVAADYDGDGKAEIAVFRPSTGYWYLAGPGSGFATFPFGMDGDMPAPHAFVY